MLQVLLERLVQTDHQVSVRISNGWHKETVAIKMTFLKTWLELRELLVLLELLDLQDLRRRCRRISTCTCQTGVTSESSLTQIP